MHPAFSVIFLTTLIGAAQGLFLALFTAQSYAAFKLLPQPDAHAFYGQGSLLALALLVGGLAPRSSISGIPSVPGAPPPSGAPPGFRAR
jgi:DMSO reductase anchor subunit